jgi:hypothetical protein
MSVIARQNLPQSFKLLQEYSNYRLEMEYRRKMIANKNAVLGKTNEILQLQVNEEQAVSNLRGNTSMSLN